MAELLRAEHAPTEPADFNGPCDQAEGFTGPGRNALQGGDVAGGERRTDEARTAGLDVLDAAVQYEPDGAIVVTFSGEPVGILEQGASGLPRFSGRQFFLGGTRSGDGCALRRTPKRMPNTSRAISNAMNSTATVTPIQNTTLRTGSAAATALPMTRPNAFSHSGRSPRRGAAIVE